MINFAAEKSSKTEIMIQKIEKIKSIGNYENYVASGDVALKKLNLIYAENGAGKTTLARVLHSMSINDSEIISNHKRISAITEPEVSIIDENGPLNFNANRWNRIKSNVVVFDAHFVSENIYTGFQINSEHRKHLYKFVLGDIGVDIARKIERVKQLIDNKNNEKVDLANQIQIASKGQDVDNVCNLQPVEGIGSLIQAKKKEQKVAQDNNIILKQLLLPLFPIFPFSHDIENLKQILSFSIDGICKEYLEIVKNHLDKLDSEGLEKSTQWVYEGFHTIISTNKKECPFCGNSIEGIKLIEGYNQFFSEKYAKSVSLTKELKKEISAINVSLFISQLTNFNERFEELNNFWTNYLIIEDEKPSFDYDVHRLCSSLQSLNEAIEAKLANPLENISNNLVDNFNTELHALSEVSKGVNEYINSYNTKISELKTKIRKTEDIAKELTELELSKARFENPLMSLCLKYNVIKHQLNRLQQINRIFQSQQKEESNQVFQQYGQKINYYLCDVFHTKFQISEIKDGGIRGRAKEANLNYILTFNGIPIEQESESNTSFKNALSEGDKNTISFSFFLAKLTTKTDLLNQIVVFDDPLTSLDQNRRNTTIHQLELLYQQCEQLIVLSHNLHFLIELNSITLIKNKDKKSLQIINANGISSIQEYQIKREWIDNYHRALNSMEDFLNNPLTNNQENAINSIRISLETFIKLKFCRFVPNPDQTFGVIVNNLQHSSCTFNNSHKDSVIDKLNQLVSVSWRVHHGSIEERETYSEVHLTSREAQQYVSMTLNLLNNEL